MKNDTGDYIQISGRYFLSLNWKNVEMSIKKNVKVFEGEHLNRKRNGKGKENNNKGYLIFEGEYLNGKRNGKGKEYENKGYLIFEGEYLNRKRNEKGKEYENKGH